MLHPRLFAPLTLATASWLGCSSSGEPAKAPDGTPAAGAAVPDTTAPVDTAQPAASVPPPVASADASAAPAGASSGTLSIAGKTVPLTAFELRGDEDGEYYFYAKAENEEGIALSLGQDVAEGAKIAKDRGVTGHVLEGGKIVNVGDASTMTFELAKKALGTWEKPGKCSGGFTAETKYKSMVIKASGTFEGAPCWKF